MDGSFLLETPDKRDYQVFAGLLALLLVAIAVPESGRIGGVSPLGRAKMLGTLAAVFLPPVVVGYRRDSPLVALALPYLFVAVVHFATGMWRLTVSPGPVTTVGLLFRTLVISVPLSAVVVAAIGYPLGVVGYCLQRFLRRRRGPTGR